jgi:hypothetical protein
MRKIILPFVIAGLLLAAIFGLLQVARGQAPGAQGGDGILLRENQGENVREISAPPGENAPQAPNIGFIDSPTGTCYQPDPGQDACYLNWYYASVNASPNYMVAMTITVNTVGIVARMAGFFQTSMYVPYSMFDRGFKVACGALGAGGNAQLGNAYSWTINARDSSNLKSANYGTAYCPAYTP